MILKGVWKLSREHAIQMGAYKCCIEFGKFVQTKHPLNFLRNTAKDFVPMYLNVDNIDQQIINQWKMIEYVDKEDSMQQYLTFAQANVKQFGTASVNAKIHEVNEKPCEARVMIGSSHEDIIVTGNNGKIILRGPHSAINIEVIPPNQFTIKAENRVKGECSGIVKYMKVIKFVLESTYPTAEEVEQCKAQQD